MPQRQNGQQATALIVGVGGFLGMGEKDISVPVDAVQVTTKTTNTIL
jgi:PRC-barrel domain